MAGGAETPNIAALSAIARLGACESARGPDADRRVKLLIQFAVEGSLSGAYSQDYRIEGRDRYKRMRLATDEFIRRFLIHVLPKGFHRIRHYGLFARDACADNIARARELLALQNLTSSLPRPPSIPASRPVHAVVVA